MERQHLSVRRAHACRHNRLARALGLALGLGAFAVAVPDANGGTGSIVVANCNDSGPGSLRDAMANANSGDTIDMSGLGCGTINLASSLVTGVGDLTITGNFQQISGGDAIRPLTNVGGGTLILNNLLVVHGKTNGNGGCIHSMGNVELHDSLVAYCLADNPYPGAAAKGGGIFSAGNVSLTNSVVGFSEVKACNDIPCSAAGGGIYAGGILSLTNSTLDANTAYALAAVGGGAFSAAGANISGSNLTDNAVSGPNGMLARGGGGGLYAAGIVFINHSTITGNSSDGSGGGLATDQKLHMEYSTVSGNTARAGAGALAGGGVEIIRSTISGNTASLNLGGLGVFGTYSAISGNIISNSTISGNVAEDSTLGSGLFLGGNTTIISSTITANSERNTAYVAYGAGISLRNGAAVELRDTIVAGNYLLLPNLSQVASDIDRAASADGTESLSGEHNFIGHSEILVPPDTIGFMQDPQLGPLLPHGGPTFTHEPLAGSPVIDAGSSFSIEFWDQRGTGFDRELGQALDIGAIEYPTDRIFADGFGDY